MCNERMAKDRHLGFRATAAFGKQCEEMARSCGVDLSQWFLLAAKRQISAQSCVCQTCLRPFSGEVGAAHLAASNAVAIATESAEAPVPRVKASPARVTVKAWLKSVVASKAETADLKAAVKAWVATLDPDDVDEERTPAAWQTMAENAIAQGGLSGQDRQVA